MPRPRPHSSIVSILAPLRLVSDTLLQRSAFVAVNRPTAPRAQQGLTDRSRPRHRLEGNSHPESPAGESSAERTTWPPATKVPYPPSPTDVPEGLTDYPDSYTKQQNLLLAGLFVFLIFYIGAVHLLRDGRRLVRLDVSHVPSVSRSSASSSPASSSCTS